MSISNPFNFLQPDDLVTDSIGRGSKFVRIHRNGSPFTPGDGATRFSDPLEPATASRRFRPISMAKEFITAFGEAIVQNRRDYGQYDPVLLAELIGMTVSTIEVDDLTLLSLLAPARIGIPTDAIRGSKDTEGRQLAEAVWQKFPHLHGFLYPSRITTELCLMVYDRCASRLTTVDQTPLMRHHLLSHALDYYRLQLKV